MTRTSDPQKRIRPVAGRFHSLWNIPQGPAVNDLANAIKPALMAGDRLELKIRKEGKEENQGIGYLDDGTMVVVEGGRKYLGRDMDVEVTSVIQTQAGKMIFTKLMEGAYAR